MAQAAKQSDEETYPDGIHVQMMDVSGQKLWVATKDGSDNKPPLLMFNGIGANLELAFPFLRELKDRKAIIFDIPGVGSSPMPALPYRPSTIARMAKELCLMLGHEEVDVSGVSWGGGLAQQFAHQYPKLCRKLILAATSAGWVMIPGNPSVLSKMTNIKRYTDKGYMRSIAAEIYGGDFRTDETLINRHADGMRPASNAGYVLQLLAMVGWTSAHWLLSIKQPTLVMAGTDDPLVPVANANFLAKMIPDATLELNDNGHLFLVTQPKYSADVIGKFLDG